MSTLFQLHSNVAQLPEHYQQIHTLATDGDAIVLIGGTVNLIELIAHLPPSQLLITDYYALQQDYQLITTDQQVDAITSLSVNFISDHQWVELTQEYDIIVTIT